MIEQGVMRPYEVHVFVCIGGKTCPTQGSDAIWAALKAGIRDRTSVRVNKAGCMSQCGHGPMVCVYPEGVWYSGVGPADIDPILDHLHGGPIHEKRVYAPAQPGANKVPRDE